MKGNFFKWKESVLERGTRKWVGVVDWVVRGVEVAWEKSITIECGGAVCLLVHGDVGVVGLKLLLINAREMVVFSLAHSKRHSPPYPT